MTTTLFPVEPLKALLSHWLRHKGQFATLALGLALATGLWTGVQAINTEARVSYERAATALAETNISTIQRRDGKPMSLAAYVALQRAGWRTSPLIEGRVELGGKTYRVAGVDIVTAPADMAFLSNDDGQQPDIFDGLSRFLGEPGQLWVAPTTAENLTNLDLAAEIVPRPGLADGLIVADIGVAAKLLDMGSTLSRLLVSDDQIATRPSLASVNPELTEITPGTAPDTAQLTESFHLNLTAFGLLAFGVGLFIVHGAIGLAFEQRRTVFRTLRLLGVSVGELVWAAVVELAVLALFAGGLGVALGYLLAGALLPDVAATLRGLYGASVTGDLSFRPQWWLGGLAIALIGTAIAAASSLWKLSRLSPLAALQPRSWLRQSSRVATAQAAVSLALLSAALFLANFGGGLVMGFAVLAALLLGSALLLPSLIRWVLSVGYRYSGSVLGQWFWADTKQQIPGLSLALMALFLALATNVGVTTMVGSFRATFVGWLDQRLAPEVYVRAATEAQAKDIRAWLTPRVDAVLPVWSAEVSLQGRSGRLYGISNHKTYPENWPMLSLAENGWQQVASGKSALINEQLARLMKLEPGDKLSIDATRSLPIAGVYSDYGNTSPQAMVNVDLLTKWYPGVSRLRHAIRIAPDKAAKLIADLRLAFDLPARGVTDQASIKRISLSVFERTFSVTAALSVLTLGVAGFAIFTSLLTLAAIRLPQVAPVWAIGLTRRQIALMELARALVLAIVTAIVALPVGLMLAWVLLAIVNVEAFGWRLPLLMFPASWLQLFGFALVAAALAAALPSRRIARMPPAELVKVFTHDR